MLDSSRSSSPPAPIATCVSSSSSPSSSHLIALSHFPCLSPFSPLHLLPRICITHLPLLSRECARGARSLAVPVQVALPTVSSAALLSPLAHHLHPPFYPFPTQRPRLSKCRRFQGALRQPRQNPRDWPLNRNSRIAREAWPSDRPTPPSPLHRLIMRIQKLLLKIIVRLPIMRLWIA